MRNVNVSKIVVLLPFVALLSYSNGYAVEEVSVTEETVSDFDITPQDEDYFGWLPGETFNSRTGRLGYYVTDLRAEGNGSLDIVINRKFNKVANQPLAGDALYPELFGSMSLDLPRIEFTTQEVVRSAKDVELWNAPYVNEPEGERPNYTVAPYDPTPRCSGLSLYTHVSNTEVGPSGTVTNPSSLISGITFHINNKTINFYPKNLSTANTRFPAAADYVSPDNWYVDCLGTTWKVYQPNGRVYSLDQYEYRNTGYLRRNVLDNANKKTVYVKTIQDPQGNTLTYDYETVTRKAPIWTEISNSVDDQHDHQYFDQLILKSIQANDGRKVTVTRRDQQNVNCPILIDKISYNFDYGKDIRYQYDAQGSSCWLDLNRVYRKDNSLFKYTYYNPINVTNNPLPNNEEWPEEENTNINYRPGKKYHSLFALKSIQYPEGATVTYTYTKLSNCHFNQKIKVVGVDTCEDKDSAVLKQRSITGDHLPSGMIWTFGYQKFDENGEVLGSPGNPIFTRIVVDGPLVNAIRNRQLFEYALFEANNDPGTASAISGQLLRKAVVEINASGNSQGIVKDTHYKYGFGSSVVNFANLGWSQNVVSPWQTLHYARDRRLQEKTIDQGGHEFKTVYASFDAFGNAQRIAQYHDDSSAAAIGRTLDLTYYNKVSPWIVGKIKKKTVDNEDAVVVDRSFTPRGEVKDEWNYGIKSTYYYHNHGELYFIKDGRGINTRIYRNYKLGTAQTIKKPAPNNASGVVTKTRVVNNRGQIARETDWKGHVTTYEYNHLLGKRTKADPPLQVATSTGWPVWQTPGHAQYRKKITTRGSDFSQVTNYDALGRPIREYTKDASTNKHVFIYYKYATNGELAYRSLPTASNLNLAGVVNGTVTPPLGIEYHYDALGRITQEKNTADNSVTTHCYGTARCGSQIPHALVRHGVGTIDPSGHFSVVNYRAYGNPDDADIVETIQQHDSANANSRVKTDIVRDRLGFIKKVTQDGKERTYTYKPGKRLLATVKHPETGTTTYNQYDGAGNLTKKTTADGSSTTYVYDSNGLLTNENYAAGTANVAYTYDENDRTEKITTAGSALDYVYRADGLLDNETLTFDGESMLLQYDYNGLGDLKKLIYPTGQPVHYQTNAFGQVTGVTNYVDQMQYFPNGQLESATYANGHVFTATQTARQFPEDWTSVSGFNTAIDQTYDYDSRGNVKSLMDRVTPTYSLSGMEYDGLNRLTDVNGKWGVGQFEYHDNGDIKKMKLGAETLTYDYNHNYGDQTGLLYTVNSTSGLKNYQFDYDTNGNVIDNSRFGFVYDDASRMTHADVNGRIYDFVYDGNGRRIRSIRQDTDNANNPIASTKVTEYFFYNQGGDLVYEKNKNTNQRKDHIYVNGKKLAYRSDHNDALDSDGDGIPDYFEDLHGLAVDNADGTQDSDNDGLTNLQEFFINANPNSVDTDNDGISDHLEDLFGLNVVLDDSGQDADGDGVTNLNEITAGSSANDALTQSRMLNALPSIHILFAP